jgi:hypothetical protein
VTLWAFFLAALGIVLCVVGANASLGTKLGEQPAIGRGARLSAYTGRLAVRTGVVFLLLGGGLFVLGIIIHTLRLLITLLFLVVIVVALVAAWGHLRRPQSRL